MSMKSFRLDPRRGSALLASMIVITVLSFAAAGILSYSLNTYENSMRQAKLDEAREVADSEMEFLYFKWKGVIMSRQVGIDSVAGSNFTTAVTPTLAPFVSSPEGTASSAPFDQNMQSASNQPQWSVTRLIEFNPVGPSTGDGSAEGIVQGNLIGKNYYFTAEVSASYTSAVLGTITYHTGRHFAYSSTPLFQYAVFYQGNLELAPGSNMVIDGPISTNASAFLGSHSGYTLTLTDQVAFYQDYNGAVDPLSGETDYLEAPTGAAALSDPSYNPNPNSSPPSNQAAQRALQVTKLVSQASFIGGVDIQADINNPAYTAAYNSDPNEIYRAVIAPPPLAADGVTELTEDPVVAASRMYNTAGMVITIEDTGSGPTVHVGIANTTSNPNNYKIYDSDFTSVSSALGGGGLIQGARTQVIDPREYANGISAVNLSTLDVSALATQLAVAKVADPGGLGTTYNGVVYVYDKTGTNDPSVAPGTLDGIRLINGATTPDYRDVNNNPLGFSVVSNNGVYIQGDYNTTQITVPGSATLVNNPTAVMGDAVTALSTNWNITAQEASNGIATVANISNRKATLPSTDNDVMTINTAILTGNTPSAGTGANPLTDYNSGGAQNLLRMTEDWYSQQADGNYLTLKLDGSLGQLFTSKYFNSHYTGNSPLTALTSTAGGTHSNPVYTQPQTRDFYYDTGFKDRAPAGAPTTTAFTRGDFFFW
jgi:hypothetical protein